MKKIIGLGALFTVFLLFAGNAQAGLFDWFSRCPCPPQPSCALASTAGVEGTTSYTSAYQAAEGRVAPARRAGTMPSPSLPRTEYMRQYQLYRYGH